MRKSGKIENTTVRMRTDQEIHLLIRSQLGKKYVITLNTHL